MKDSEKRQRLRAILAGNECFSPATVFDGLSARVAESVGYRIAILSGSVSAATLLAAPDIAAQTLTEFAEQVRRITRASDLSLILDADHGYGNALNVMRTIEELEHAGAAAIMIEDTVMPARFGSDRLEVIPDAEMAGKLRAALKARRDPSLLVVGRIAALKAENVQRAAERARLYETTGIDAIFITGLRTLEEFDAIRAAVRLPIIVGLAPALRRDDLAKRGVRVLLQGHQPVSATVKALQQVYTQLYGGGLPADLKPLLASAEDMKRVLNVERYEQWRQQFLS